MMHPSFTHPSFEGWQRVHGRAGHKIFRLEGSPTCDAPGPVPRTLGAQRPMKFAGLWLPVGSVVAQISIGNCLWLMDPVPGELLTGVDVDRSGQASVQSTRATLILLGGQELTVITDGRVLLGLAFQVEQPAWVSPNARGGRA